MWSLDYCLTCDRQTSGEAYCSQNCRLADLDTSTFGSEPSSPTTTQTSRSGFVLPPAFDFSAYRRGTPPLVSSRPSSSGSTSTPPLAPQGHSPRRTVTMTARSSLSSSPSGETISSQAKTELRGYTNSFDQVRDFRRRRIST